MKIFRTVKEITSYLTAENLYNKTGFVPTMGALHSGHIALVERSVKENVFTVVSVFINPKQFNDKSDFEKYPVTIDKDTKMLEEAGCNILFYPNADDIYKDYNGHITDFKGLDKIYEGEFRPGHFQGVVDVVYRLFDIVKPKRSYFGEKDFQQLAVIQLMVRNAFLPIEIIPCKIIREETGLAMSSRNERLSSYERYQASNIYKIMNSFSKDVFPETNPANLAEKIALAINKNVCLKTEYVVFCEPKSLKSVNVFVKNEVIRLCVAVWCGKIRLIDNISLHI